jgi:large conductance mechanosensitive channel
MGFVTEFKEFAVKGSVIDLAVGVIIGGAFGTIVTSLTKDLLMPLVGMAIGDVNFSNMFVVLKDIPADYAGAMTYADLTAAGIPLFAYGNFITVVINFTILAFLIFMMVKQINRLKKTEPAPTPAAAVVPEDVVLLREIRDSLKK